MKPIVRVSMLFCTLDALASFYFAMVFGFFAGVVAMLTILLCYLWWSGNLKT